MNLYKRINQHLGHHALIYIFLSLILGLIIGLLITYYFGINIGNSKLYHNGTCFILDGFTSTLEIC